MTKWNFTQDDHPILIYFAVVALIAFWLITFCAFPLEVKWIGKDKPKIYGGWLTRLVDRVYK